MTTSGSQFLSTYFQRVNEYVKLITDCENLQQDHLEKEKCQNVALIALRNLKVSTALPFATQFLCQKPAKSQSLRMEALKVVAELPSTVFDKEVLIESIFEDSYEAIICAFMLKIDKCYKCAQHGMHTTYT